MKTIFKIYRLAWDAGIFAMGVFMTCGFFLYSPVFFGLVSFTALFLLVFDYFAQRQFEAEIKKEG